MKSSRRPTIQEQKTKKLQSQLVSTQAMAADLYEQNAKKDEMIIGLQSMVSTLYEGGNS